MTDSAKLKAQISAAFSEVEYPGDWCLRGSNQGNEPFLLEEEFKGKTDWRSLEPAFLDQAPDGYSSALSFFSDEAFHFYLPAYLIADIDGLLGNLNPLFHLCYGLDDESWNNKTNLLRPDEPTRSDRAKHTFAMFNRAEAEAIVAYLQYVRDREPDDMIDQALRNYWLDRIA